ncbi:MAG: hypothetical protein AAGN66_12235 [Acidobacteriota bacterium]
MISAADARTSVRAAAERRRTPPTPPARRIEARVLWGVGTDEPLISGGVDLFDGPPA